MKNLIEKTFGRLTVIGDSGERNSKGAIFWNCLCSCGKNKKIITSNLTGGLTKSCGCLAREMSSKRAKMLFTKISHSCSVRGCLGATKKGAKGFCGMHYMRIKRYGHINGKADLEMSRIKKRHIEMERRPAGEKTYRKFYGRHEHRLIGEIIAKRPLLSSEHVHHVDENRHNNKRENLQIMSASEHAIHHRNKKI